jgi:hypothetical protein
MLFCGLSVLPQEAQLIYDHIQKRKSIATVSQKRYSAYFSDCILRKYIFPKTDTIIFLTALIIYTTPHYDRERGCKLCFRVDSKTAQDKTIVTDVKMDSRIKYKPVQVKNAKMFSYDDLDLELQSDILVTFFELDTFNKPKMIFTFQFNTNFLDTKSGTLKLTRDDLDLRNKSKESKERHFDENFRIELKFNLIQQGEEQQLCVDTCPERFGVLPDFDINAELEDEGDEFSFDDDFLNDGDSHSFEQRMSARPFSVRGLEKLKKALSSSNVTTPATPETSTPVEDYEELQEAIAEEDAKEEEEEEPDEDEYYEEEEVVVPEPEPEPEPIPEPVKSRPLFNMSVKSLDKKPKTPLVFKNVAPPPEEEKEKPRARAISTPFRYVHDEKSQETKVTEPALEESKQTEETVAETPPPVTSAPAVVPESNPEPENPMPKKNEIEFAEDSTMLLDRTPLLSEEHARLYLSFLQNRSIEVYGKKLETPLKSALLKKAFAQQPSLFKRIKKKH